MTNFFETAIQDTYHFSLFHVLYNFHQEIIGELNDLFIEATKMDIIISTFIIEEIKLELIQQIDEARKVMFNNFSRYLFKRRKNTILLENIINDNNLVVEINDDLYHYLRQYDIKKLI